MNIPPVNAMAKRSQDFDALQTTLQAGNLAGAQSAFGALLQDVQTTASAGGSSSIFAPGTQASRDLQALGGALKSANLPGAQAALANLKQDLQAAGPASTAVIVNHRHARTRSEIAHGATQLVDKLKVSSAASSLGSILNSKV
jgi:hypothetical protein